MSSLDNNEVRRICWLTIAEAFGLDVTTTATMIFQAPTYTVSTLPTDPYGHGGSFSNNRYTVPMLRGLEVSKLTPEQRIEVLAMISQAGSDREISQDEARAILKEVNQLSGRGPYPFVMA